MYKSVWSLALLPNPQINTLVLFLKCLYQNVGDLKQRADPQRVSCPVFLCLPHMLQLFRTTSVRTSANNAIGYLSEHKNNIWFAPDSGPTLKCELQKVRIKSVILERSSHTLKIEVLRSESTPKGAINHREWNVLSAALQTRSRSFWCALEVKKPHQNPKREISGLIPAWRKHGSIRKLDVCGKLCF